MRALFRAHDLLTTASAWLAAAGIGTITFSYCYEVVSRYVFNAPTNWVGAVTTYLLLVCTMLMAPYVTRARAHVTITFLLERLGHRRARHLLAGCVAVSAVVCLLSVWFTGTETWRQYLAGTTIVELAHVDAEMDPVGVYRLRIPEFGSPLPAADPGHRRGGRQSPLVLRHGVTAECPGT